MTRSLGDILNLQSAAYPRTAVLPDSLLPFALKRDQLALRPLLFTPNQFDADILNEAGFWQWSNEHGGLKTCCRIKELGAPVWSVPPFLAMPSNGLKFQNMFVKNTSAIPFDGADHLLGSFQVDSGYDGAITNFVCGFNGTGFDEGSGNIVWRALVGQRFLKTLGNVKFTFGDLSTALSVPGSSWPIISQQTVQLFVNIPIGSPVTGGQVFAGVLGWTYPRR